MRRIVIAALLLAGLAASAAIATPAPKWTAKGKLTHLGLHRITVHGISCKITSDSPGHATLRIFVGADVKISCLKGILESIDALKKLPGVTIQTSPGSSSSSSSSVSSSSSSVSSSSSSSSSQTSSSSALSIGGNFPVKAIGGGSITVTAGSHDFTCTIGSGSPDVSGLQAGDRLTSMRCANGALAALTRAT